MNTQQDRWELSISRNGLPPTKIYAGGTEARVMHLLGRLLLSSKVGYIVVRVYKNSTLHSTHTIISHTGKPLTTETPIQAIPTMTPPTTKLFTLKMKENQNQKMRRRYYDRT